MKRIIYLIGIFSVALLASCNMNKNEKPLTQEENKEIEKIVSEVPRPHYLDKNKFIAQVWDYQANPKEWVYKGDKPCIIDFYADWCGPCKMVAPIMDELARDYHGKLMVYKIDTDKEPEIAALFNVQSIPAVLFCPVQGRPMMQVGAYPKQSYVDVIQKELIKQ